MGGLLQHSLFMNIRVIQFPQHECSLKASMSHVHEHSQKTNFQFTCGSMCTENACKIDQSVNKSHDKVMSLT